MMRRLGICAFLSVTVIVDVSIWALPTSGMLEPVVQPFPQLLTTPSGARQFHKLRQPLRSKGVLLYIPGLRDGFDFYSDEFNEQARNNRLPLYLHLGGKEKENGPQDALFADQIELAVRLIREEGQDFRLTIISHSLAAGPVEEFIAEYPDRAVEVNQFIFINPVMQTFPLSNNSGRVEFHLPLRTRHGLKSVRVKTSIEFVEFYVRIFQRIFERPLCDIPDVPRCILINRIDPLFEGRQNDAAKFYEFLQNQGLLTEVHRFEFGKSLAVDAHNILRTPVFRDVLHILEAPLLNGDRPLRLIRRTSSARENLFLCQKAFRDLDRQ